MSERRYEQLITGRVRDVDVVLLRRPVNPSVISDIGSSSWSGTSQSLDPEVPLRMPIDRPSSWGYVLLPLAGTSPPPRGANPLMALRQGGRQSKALSRWRSRHPEDDL